MKRYKQLTTVLLGSACAAMVATSALAGNFNIPGGDLKSALDGYAAQTGVALIYPAREVAGVRTKGARGDLAADAALSRILSGTGFIMRRHASGAIAIVHNDVRSSTDEDFKVAQITPVRVASAAAASGIESVVVTSSKIKGDIQTVPIAITALSQEQLTSRQIAGGPDLVKEVPNLTFSKTNFTGYNIQIRGIGTQAISVTTDPAVAVAFNDMPFIRNHFFEQEFYDVGQVEVLRGPQGTLYGRNATAGVVNIISAKPTDQFEAMLSADWGNYLNRRYEGMVNIPIVDDRVDLRVAGEWTKRDGYSFNELTGKPIDGRDLWSSRVTLGLHPTSKLQAYLVWEHFQEDDDRIRSSKQLCKRAPIPDEIDGRPTSELGATGIFVSQLYSLSQTCLPASLYSAESFEVPNGLTLPYVLAIGTGLAYLNYNIDPYADKLQSRNLRDIQSALNPVYRAKNDVIELNADYAVTDALTFSSQTGFNHDFLWATEDFNRFNTSPGIFLPSGALRPNQISADGVFCDPQLGCSDRLVAEDLSEEHAWQLSQEFRLASNFEGPFNFSIGGNYLHYETEENYYVFINSLSLFASSGPFLTRANSTPWMPGISDNSECMDLSPTKGVLYNNSHSPTFETGGGNGCPYIDPNPIGHLNNRGHNYFLSQNPYVLNSYAGFGETYYQVAPQLKLTGGLRWTEDQKHFILIPSQVLTDGWGYPHYGSVDQKWDELTGRFAANWTPKLDFTEQTLVYGSYAHGYKAGGANPPGAILLIDAQHQPTHPLTFEPEFVDAFELGTKNTLLDGGLTLNGDVFYYNYKGYQISQIVDRTSVNLNFDATVKGAELETTWEPLPGLKFSFAGGYEDTRINNGQSAIDLIDRTAGNSDWIVIKPFINESSNCIIPAYVAKYTGGGSGGVIGTNVESLCDEAYIDGIDPLTQLPYVANPTVNKNGSQLSASGIVNYPGFDPRAGTPGDPYTGQNTSNGHDYGPAPNNGTGFDKNLGGNELPNAPHFTTSLTAEYTIPVSEDWAATLHSDFYWQSQSFARVFNDRPYDKLRGYSNVNLALVLTGASGWQVIGYLKNIFDTTAITGAFLNSDDSGLTTNVFLTDPRLFGVRVTKNW